MSRSRRTLIRAYPAAAAAALRPRAWLAAALLCAIAPPAYAQVQPAAGGIHGRVIDAQTQAPLEGATVTLEPRGGGVFPQPREGGLLRSTLSTTTDSAGEYLFRGLPPGDYRLHVQRLGYASATAEVTFRGAVESRVSVGLRVNAVALEPVRVDGLAAGPAPLPNPAPRHGARIDAQRIAAERARQQAHLPSDVRVVTRADVAQGITFGETDLFRALQRLPGVGASDEYSAELATRGARADQTRIYFDGLPVFAPLHAGGMFAGINADAVGAVLLHPGMQPARLGGGAAGAVEMQSRRGGVDAPRTTVGELSLVSARLTHDARTRDDATAVLVSVRRTYLDWLTSAVNRFVPDEDVRLPYNFWDALVRVDRAVGTSSSVELSSVLSFDRLSGDLPDVLHRTRASWGGGAGRVTLNTPLLGGTARHTLGMSGYRSRIAPAPGGRADSIYNAPGSPPSRNDVTHLTLLGELRGTAAWAAGYELTSQDVAYDGPRPGILEAPPFSRPVRVAGGSRYAALWADHRASIAPRLAAQAGLRLEAGGGGSRDAAVRLAPRLGVRYEAGPQLYVSAALGRSYQYVQALGGAGIRPVDGFHGEYVWITAGGDVPLVSSDVLTLGAERWLGDAWLAGITLHGRRSDGIVLPHPIPGVHDVAGQPSVPRDTDPLFGVGRNEASGVELALKRVAGRATASVAYAYGVSELLAGGVRFPAPTDRRHTFDATAQLRVSDGWRVGAAYALASGAPYTRTSLGTLLCSAADVCFWESEPWVGEAGAFRGRASHSLDVLTEWTRSFGGWQGGFFIQIRNVLNRSNQGRYTGYQPGYCGHGSRCGPGGDAPWIIEPRDEFLPGAPIVPVFGFRFAK